MIFTFFNKANNLVTFSYVFHLLILKIHHRRFLVKFSEVYLQNITSGLLCTFRTRPIEMMEYYVTKIILIQHVRFLIALPLGVCRLHSTSSTTMNVDVVWSIIPIILTTCLEICVKLKFTVFPFKSLSLFLSKFHFLKHSSNYTDDCSYIAQNSIMC